MLPGASANLTDEIIAQRLREHLDDPASAQASASAIQAFQEFLPTLRPAAVLVPLLQVERVWHVLYTRRTDTVQNHKGQVSFPGGAAEAGDAGPEATAMREAFEEIGLRPSDVRVLGLMPERPIISSFRVTPVVAHIPWPYDFLLSTQEVNRVFTLPLDWLADPANWEERRKAVHGTHIEPVIYYQPFDEEILWGATARITLDLLHALKIIE